MIDLKWWREYLDQELPSLEIRFEALSEVSSEKTSLKLACEQLEELHSLQNDISYILSLDDETIKTIDTNQEIQKEIQKEGQKWFDKLEAFRDLLLGMQRKLSYSDEGKFRKIQYEIFNKKNPLEQRLEKKFQQFLDMSILERTEQLNDYCLGASEENIACVKKLIELGVNIDGDGTKKIPLIIAAQCNSNKIFKILLKASANPLLKDAKIGSALSIAVTLCHYDIVNSLLELETSVVKRFICDENIEEILAFAMKYESLQVIQAQETAKLLLIKIWGSLPDKEIVPPTPEPIEVPTPRSLGFFNAPKPGYELVSREELFYRRKRAEAKLKKTNEEYEKENYEKIAARSRTIISDIAMGHQGFYIKSLKLKSCYLCYGLFAELGTFLFRTIGRYGLHAKDDPIKHNWIQLEIYGSDLVFVAQLIRSGSGDGEKTKLGLKLSAHESIKEADHAGLDEAERPYDSDVWFTEDFHYKPGEHALGEFIDWMFDQDNDDLRGDNSHDFFFGQHAVSKFRNEPPYIPGGHGFQVVPEQPEQEKVSLPRNR